MRSTRPWILALTAAVALIVCALPAQAGRPRPPAPDNHEPVGQQTFTSPQANSIIVDSTGGFVYVANTTSNTVSVVGNGTVFNEIRQIEVGLEPVSLALNPAETELWVSNHVSDTVSVIDVALSSATYGQIVETIQALGPAGTTDFDEPVGIAFDDTGLGKAYVALSSTDRIAVIDTGTYSVTGFIDVRAQEPRAIAIHNGLLYVPSFESGNQSELSVCVAVTQFSAPQCTMDLLDLLDFITEPNIPNANKGIVKDPDVPDRDLFLYSTTTDTEVDVVDGLGTLLYGLAIDSQGRAFISNADARNEVNGLDGDVLVTLENRMFDNRVSAITCGAGGCSGATIVDLEGGATTPANSVATPYGVALSGDDSVVFMTGAGVNRLVSLDAGCLSCPPIDMIQVGAIPKAVAFHPNGAADASGTAWVLNTLDNSISRIPVLSDGSFANVQTQMVGSDPTPTAVRLGRIAFNNALASNTGNFSCGSCHPDGNTDQLLWRIGGNCSAIGCAPGDEPRSTMPIRGLKNTLPLHWDGTLGDPFGGGNGAVGVNGNGGTDCALGDADGDHDCFLALVDAALSGVMCDQDGAANPAGCPSGGTLLTPAERSDMATFLGEVAYPPARSRRMDDSISTSSDTFQPDVRGIPSSALQGFADFFMNQNSAGNPRSCADTDGGCHSLPLGVSTNSATLNGFDAPTMRGMTDRTLQFSLGVTSAEEIQQFALSGIDIAGFFFPPTEPELGYSAAEGLEEAVAFGNAFLAFDGVYGVRAMDIFQMIEEASTGHSGATGRQITLNTITAHDAAAQQVMGQLEAADDRGVINLRAVGRRNGQSISLTYRSTGFYEKNGLQLTPAEVLAEAQAGTLLVTLTAALRENVGTSAQPLISDFLNPGFGVIDDPNIPHISSGASNPSPFTVTGLDVDQNAIVFVDGAVAANASLTCLTGATAGICNEGSVSVDLTSRPANGPHLLQVQNPSGLQSNELPFCVGSANGCLSD
jgi:YVTN family beta-propeller protein